MKLDTLLHSMLRDLWVDLHDPSVGWQLGLLAACLVVAWGLEQALLRWWARSQPGRDGVPASGTVRATLQALGRLLFPVFALALVVVTRPVLALWEKTDLLRVAIVLLVALALVRAIVHAVSRLSRTPGLAAFERLLVALVWIGVALHVTGYSDDVVDFLEKVVFVVGRQHVSLWAIVSGGFWMIVTILVALWAGGEAEARLLATEAGDAGVRAVLGRVLRAALLTFAVLIGMSLIGLDITALSVFGGALGVGIGLGLQRIASSYISGFVVLLERKIRIGDVVTVDKYTGTVREISTRFTVLASGVGWDAIIPNEMLLTGTVQNLSIDPMQRLVTSLTVGYDSDIDQVLAILVSCAAGHQQVVPGPQPAAFLRGFGADGFMVEVGYYINDPLNRRIGVESDVNRAIWRALKDAGVSLPHPQREVRLVAAAAPSPQ